MQVLDANTESQLLTDAINAFNGSTGIRIAARRVQPRTRQRADAELKISVDGVPIQYWAECKRRVDRKEIANLLKATLQPHGDAGLVVTACVSAEMADYCRSIDLQFIDACGNAYLRRPGLYVYIKGERAGPGHQALVKPSGLSGSALRIHFALMAHKDLVRASYRTIAAKAGVSLGAVSTTFDDLRKRNLLWDSGRGEGQRRLDARRLFNEWVSSYPVSLRPKLNSRRYSAPHPDWWTNTQLSEGAAWGGEVAAQRLTQYLKPETQTIYSHPDAMQASLKSLVVANRLRLDPNGTVEVLTKFWTPTADEDETQVVPPVLVYADLMATTDSRNIETANLIKERYIELALHSS